MAAFVEDQDGGSEIFRRRRQTFRALDSVFAGRCRPVAIGHIDELVRRYAAERAARSRFTDRLARARDSARRIRAGSGPIQEQDRERRHESYGCTADAESLQRRFDRHMLIGCFDFRQ